MKSSHVGIGKFSMENVGLIGEIMFGEKGKVMITSF